VGARPVVTPHAITPKPGTVTRERDGAPADLMDRADYPVLATCVTCDRPVWCERMYLAEWEHVDGGGR
jgi:hypothetical protein